MDEAQQEPSVDEVAYEQLPASMQRLLDALDGTNLTSLPAQRRELLEAAIRGVLHDNTLLGSEEGANARLIAAAPELLGLLTRFKEQNYQIKTSDIDDVDAAIAHAEEQA